MRGFDLTQGLASGLGNQVVIRPANPGAGNNLSIALDSRWVWRLSSCVFTLTTSATVANRYVTVEYAEDTGASASVNAASVLVLAGSTQRFAGSAQRTVAEWNTGTDVLFPLDPVFMYPGGTLQILVAGIQVGDTLTAIRFIVERFSTDVTGLAAVTG